jgi:hypothetical protein
MDREKNLTRDQIFEIEVREWNQAAELQRKRIFLALYGFDPENEKECCEGLDRYFKK